MHRFLRLVYARFLVREEERKKGVMLMRYITISLALLAVAAMTNVAMAAITVSLLPNPLGPDLSDPADMLVGYTVHITGSNAFQDLRVIGAVHQMNMNYGSLTPTGWDTDLAADPAAKPFDTHLITPAAGINAIETVVTETNDNSNPGGFAAYAYAPFNCYGMGTFDASGVAYAVKGPMDPAGYDVIYIVLRKGDWVSLTGKCVDVAQGTLVDFVFPEPGTLIMLVAGALCLLGIRRRAAGSASAFE
jgi:hypothetical protein